jgi:hypothetical protein
MFGRFRRSHARERAAEARAEALRTIILKQGDNQRGSEETKKAIAYCEWCISEYESWFDWNEGRWLLWQKITIIGGVVATLAGVVSIPPDWHSFSWLRGVPAAVVTIAASYLGSFSYKEDAVRHELTANALWNELAKFQTCAQPYDIDEASDRSLFLKNVCRLVETELHSWSTLVRGSNANANDPRRTTTEETRRNSKGGADV